ncbi:MAG: FAD-dependent oxidoreductase [Ginsengibacter sp.]
MDLKSGFPFSLIKNGLLHNYASLKESGETEIVILGGGISGALAAFYLTRAGLQCTVIDHRNIGLGSTCASTSLLQYEIDVPLCKLKKMIGDRNAERAYHLCAQSIDTIKEIAELIGYDQFEYKSSLYYAANKNDVSFLNEEFGARKKSGFDVSLLNAQEIKNQYGFNSTAAILSKLGGQVDAYTFTHALHQYNIQKGCRVFENTTIKKIDHQKENVLLTTKDNLTINCRHLVYATGYETVNFIKKKIVNLHSTYVIVSPHDTIQENTQLDKTLIWNTDDPYLYMRTTQDGRLIVGGRDEPFYNPEKRDRLLDKKAAKLEQDFNNLFPEIAFETEFKWTGTFGTTKDGLPFIGPYKKLPNSFFSLGFGGNGITFSVIAAQINCDIILGKLNPDREIFKFER